MIRTILFTLMLFLTACTLTIEAPVDDPIDIQLLAFIDEQGITCDPSQDRDLPTIESPLAQLGKHLFFTKALSGEMDVACATCHLPTLGGGDGLALSVGVEAENPDLIGPGRLHIDGQPNVPRNAPTTFNVGMWDKSIFWDGRIESLGRTPGRSGNDGMGIRTPDSILGMADARAGNDLITAQSRFPVTSKEEMRGFDFETSNNHEDIRKHLAARLGNYGIGAGELPSHNGWPARFETVFGPASSTDELITEQRIWAALSAYQRSQVFVDNAWSRYMLGDKDAISADAKAGALLFYQSAKDGGANCASCHGGDFFTDELFHVLAVPQVGPGKEGEYDEFADYGRFRETKHRDDLYAFRTPSLLNVEVTGPYGHSGAYATLEGIVRHHLNPADAIENYDFSQLAPDVQQAHMAEKTEAALWQLEGQRARDMFVIQDVVLADQEVEQLVSFLQTLTDPCVTDAVCLAPWMPSKDEPDPDGQRLQAVVLE